MSASLRKNAISSPLLSSEKQGIVTILRSDQVNSLRRTLSADMSSHKWLAQHGLSPAMKKIASSGKFSVSASDSSSSSDSEGDSDNLSFIPEKNRRGETERKPLPIDIWSSILSNKAGEEASKSLPPPYIHPLVKRSASTLSEKSLEICTESLGSETGSDGFSSYPASETGDDVKDEDESEEEKTINFSQRVKFNEKKSPSRSFPPPLAWLSGFAGASVRVQSRRENGRLTLEAVYEPSQNNFLAHRQDGRLVLSFADYEELDADLKEEGEEENEEKLVNLEDQDEEYSQSSEEEEEEAEEDKNDRQMKTMQMEIMMKNGVINIHRLTLMVKRPSGLANNRFNEENKTEEEVQILKPRLSPPLTTAMEAPSSSNAYEYYWRSKALALTKPIRQETPSSLSKNNSPTKLYFLKNKGDDHSASFSKQCKEPRRSLLFWEPYCIATS